MLHDGESQHRPGNQRGNNAQADAHHVVVRDQDDRAHVLLLTIDEHLRRGEEDDRRGGGGEERREEGSEERVSVGGETDSNIASTGLPFPLLSSPQKTKCQQV